MTKRIGIYNGSLDQLDKIVVSPMSRAFLFSDSIYEVIPFHKSEFIGFQAHIERLDRSAAMLDINIDINIDIQSKNIDLISIYNRKISILYRYRIDIVSIWGRPGGPDATETNFWVIVSAE